MPQDPCCLTHEDAPADERATCARCGDEYHEDELAEGGGVCGACVEDLTDVEPTGREWWPSWASWASWATGESATRSSTRG